MKMDDIYKLKYLAGITDRDGNNPFMKNNSLRMMAVGLYENDIDGFILSMLVLSIFCLIPRRNGE